MNVGSLSALEISFLLQNSCKLKTFCKKLSDFIPSNPSYTLATSILLRFCENPSLALIAASFSIANFLVPNYKFKKFNVPEENNPSLDIEYSK